MAVIPETCSTHTHTHTHTDAYSLHTPRGGQCPPNQHQRLANNTHTGTQTHIQNTSRRPLLSKQHQRTASKHIHTKRHTRTHTHTPLGGHCPPNSTSTASNPHEVPQEALEASSSTAPCVCLCVLVAVYAYTCVYVCRQWMYLAVQHPVYSNTCACLFAR